MGRWLSLLPFLVGGWSVPAAAAAFELELGGGGASVSQNVSPAITGRVGVDFLDHFSASARLLALGTSQRSLTPTQGDWSSLYQTWAGVGELRLHTSGNFQLSAALGVGAGASTPSGALTPYEEAGLGARLRMFDLAWIAADVWAFAWNSSPGYVPSPTQNLGAMLTLSVGGRLDFL